MNKKVIISAIFLSLVINPLFCMRRVVVVRKPIVPLGALAVGGIAGYAAGKRAAAKKSAPAPQPAQAPVQTPEQLEQRLAAIETSITEQQKINVENRNAIIELQNSFNDLHKAFTEHDEVIKKLEEKTKDQE